jgi:hypothetical protein
MKWFAEDAADDRMPKPHRYLANDISCTDNVTHRSLNFIFVFIVVLKY